MKATSIEQIREHLAKGGRALAVLKDGRTDEVKRVDMGMLRVYAGIWSSSFACVDVDHWQLLPLEEKEPVDHGTQKGQEERFRDSQKERMQRIRQRLLHGQWPDMSDLMAWWEATTGERIEMGKRCDACNCSGLAQEGRVRACEDCQGSGYSVRPTWMGDSK